MNPTQNPLDVKLTPSSLAKVAITFVILAVLWTVVTRYALPALARFVPGAGAVTPGTAYDGEAGHMVRTV